MVASAVGVDVGGTFTDVVAWDGERLLTTKVATTPDQSVGVVEGATAIRPRLLDRFIHGTTVATNALLERKGADTVLVTSAGFTDIIEIGRQDRPALYDSLADRATPLVPRDRRFGVPRGGLTADDIERVVAAVADSSPEAVAVSLLFSFADPGPERALRDALRERLQAAVSASVDVAPEFREFERTSTTVLNAYLVPVMSEYLRRLVRLADGAGLPADIGVMRSSGGLMSATAAAETPAAALVSGPAGGVVAASALGTALGHPHVVSFDMGGTSTDVCRIEGGMPVVGYEQSVDGLPNRMPSVAIHTVGAGGGSIAWLDQGGALRVGPSSAGAHPGPACYGRGGDLSTVTDANLVLGRLSSELAGGLVVEPRRAEVALRRLGMDPVPAAAGVVAVVEEVMAGAIRRVSIEEGADPRDAVLVAFGGAGGLHATGLGRALGMRGVVIPAHAGVFSALGLALSPPRADAARSLDPEESIPEVIAEVRRRTVADYEAAGSGAPTEVEVRVDVRYVGQSHETVIPYIADEAELERRFHEAHRRRNGFARVGDPIEVVTVRAAATGDPSLSWDDLPAPVAEGEPARGTRDIITASGPATASVWWRPALQPGAQVVGPAVIEEPEATTYLDSDERAVVHPSGALEISW